MSSPLAAKAMGEKRFSSGEVVKKLISKRYTDEDDLSKKPMENEGYDLQSCYGKRKDASARHHTPNILKLLSGDD